MDDNLEDELENDTEEQSGNRTDHLKPWQFKPGQSGNPSGRPKGSVSLKEYAKNMLSTMTDDERQEFFKGLDKKVIWEMAEGKPKQDTELSGKDGEPLVIQLVNYGDNKDTA